MNRTELAQLLAGNYSTPEYKTILLILNQLTEEQFQKALKITKKVGLYED